MPEYYEFDCGCRVEITDPKIKDSDGLPSLHIDYENINLDCQSTWALLSSGKTRGVFQLETALGASWAKKLEPDSMEELAALISILRPGTLKSKLDGKSMTQHYVDRKQGIEQYVDIDHNVASIMTETHGIMVYQEQAMQIAQKLAGFDLKQADSLRKAIGKKLADLMAKVKVEFIEGCKKTGLVNDVKANEIFDIIEKSNRYSFNKSISPNALCQTENDEIKTVENVEIGEKIKTPNGYSSVVEKYDHGELDTFEIELENGSKIECSINHKFLCDDGIYPLYEILQKNKKIIVDDSFGVY